MLMFLTGGARSGKSRFALEQAKTLTPVIFVATAQDFDNEMQTRIAKHQAERQHLGWTTIEAPLELFSALQTLEGSIVLDCLSLWVSNMLLADKTQSELEQELNAILEWQAKRHATLIVVSNEVGSGIVPEYLLGRTYRDWLGRANQMVAASSSSAYLLVAGVPLRLK